MSRLGISRSYASELLTTRRKPKQPSLELATRIEREFGVSATAWVAREGDNRGPQYEAA